VATETGTTRGYSASKAQLIKRLSRIEGQVRGLSRMVEDDRYCIDVLTQISAVQAALDKTALGLLDGHTRHCLAGKGARPATRGKQADELMGAVARLLHRYAPAHRNDLNQVRSASAATYDKKPIDSFATPGLRKPSGRSGE
jgi:DNA-binding FrmR family transcriptional regulator